MIYEKKSEALNNIMRAVHEKSFEFFFIFLLIVYFINTMLFFEA